jgi:hypothetical protein
MALTFDTFPAEDILRPRRSPEPHATDVYCCLLRGDGGLG